MSVVEGNIEGIPVTLENSDITKQICDAYIVPQFRLARSQGGVAGAIYYAGAEKGMEAYLEYLQKNSGHLEDEHAHLTASGGGNSRYLIHVPTIAAPADIAFETVQKCTYNALVAAQKENIQTIAIPALGTGIFGKLTPAQSAKAIMSAIQQFASKGGRMNGLKFALFDGFTLNEFATVLEEKSFKNATPEAGQKEFNFAEWVAVTQRDAAQRNMHRQRN